MNMNIIAYLAPDSIPKETFLELAQNSVQENDAEIKDIRAKGKLNRAIHLLEQYSMVNLELEQDQLSIHRLVQQVIKSELKKEEKEVEVLKETLGLLKKCMVDRNSAEGYMPHIISVWNYATKYDKFIKDFIVNGIESNDVYTTYFHLIAGSSNWSSYEIVDTIIKKIEQNYPDQLSKVINAKNKDKGVPLHNAALSGDERIVKLLIEKGANVNAEKEHGWTPLLLATKNGHIDTIKALLDKDADVNAKTNEGNTPLHFALKNNNLEIVNALLGKKATVKAETEDKYTPLHLAVENGNLEIVNVLLGKEADVNAKTRDKFTSLHFAAKKGYTEIVNVLLSKNADVNAVLLMVVIN